KQQPRAADNNVPSITLTGRPHNNKILLCRACVCVCSSSSPPPPPLSSSSSSSRSSRRTLLARRHPTTTHHHLPPHNRRRRHRRHNNHHHHHHHYLHRHIHTATTTIIATTATTLDILHTAVTAAEILVPVRPPYCRIIPTTRPIRFQSSPSSPPREPPPRPPPPKPEPLSFGRSTTAASLSVHAIGRLQTNSQSKNKTRNLNIKDASAAAEYLNKCDLICFYINLRLLLYLSEFELANLYIGTTILTLFIINALTKAKDFMLKYPKQFFSNYLSHLLVKNLQLLPLCLHKFVGYIFFVYYPKGITEVIIFKLCPQDHESSFNDNVGNFFVLRHILMCYLLFCHTTIIIITVIISVVFQRLAYKSQQLNILTFLMLPYSKDNSLLLRNDANIIDIELKFYLVLPKFYCKRLHFTTTAKTIK
ncbi:hypothetical protein AGLY_005950, partial [Aphis glycines]